MPIIQAFRGRRPRGPKGHMKLRKLWKAARIGFAVAKTVATGKMAETLKRAGVYVELGERFAETLRDADRERKKD